MSKRLQTVVPPEDAMRLLQLPCKKCNAEPGELCVSNKTGIPLAHTEFHHPRWVLLQRQRGPHIAEQLVRGALAVLAQPHVLPPDLEIARSRLRRALEEFEMTRRSAHI